MIDGALESKNNLDNIKAFCGIPKTFDVTISATQPGFGDTKASNVISISLDNTGFGGAPRPSDVTPIQHVDNKTTSVF